MISGNIKLPGSTVTPCKWPVSQLFRNFDYQLVLLDCDVTVVLYDVARQNKYDFLIQRSILPQASNFRMEFKNFDFSQFSTLWD